MKGERLRVTAITCVFGVLALAAEDTDPAPNFNKREILSVTCGSGKDK